MSPFAVSRSVFRAAKLSWLTSLRPALWPAFLIGISIVRLHQCAQLPVVSADAFRHVYWGIIVNTHGYDAITKSLLSFRPDLDFVAWNQLGYNYPILSLLFDQVSAGLHSSLFTYKFLLTLVEAVNGVLVYSYSRSRLLAAFYWASPLSIWWVSREGQFEPLQNLLILAALLLIDRSRLKSLAFVVIGLAVQVKLTALCLLPYLFYRIWHTGTKVQAGLAFLLSFLPSAMLLMVANPLQLLSQSLSLNYNPYHFNVFHPEMFGADSLLVIAANQVSSYALLFVLLLYAWLNKRSGRWIEVVPILLFVIFLKGASMAQSWYLITLMPLLLPLSNHKLQKLLFCSLPLLDLFSLYKLLGSFVCGSVASKVAAPVGPFEALK